MHVYGCQSTCQFWGAATYGVARPDVAAQYGSQYLNSGYTLTKAWLTPGTYYLQVRTHSTVTGAWSLWGHNINVQAQAEHTLELPTQGAALTTPLSVQGWALNASAPSGTGIDQVQVLTFPNPGSGQPIVNFGNATYGVNRPDIAASHGERFRYSGFTKSVTSLAAGAHCFGSAAKSSHTQAWTYQWRTIYVNTPTVPLTIDRPGTGTGGVTASGLTCVGGSTTQAVPCGASYPLHTAVTLTAAPDANSTFAGWGGACTGTGTCQVTLSQARFVTATFTKLPDTIATRYYHTDVIGSVRAITDEAGATVESHDYRPFGEDTAPLTGDPNRFAGKQLDPESALHYFDARYYRNTWGRFTTVDPEFSPDASKEPQRWNRYAYAGNNPLKYIDSDGRNYVVCNVGGAFGLGCDSWPMSHSALKGALAQDHWMALGTDTSGEIRNEDGGTGNGYYYYECGYNCEFGVWNSATVGGPSAEEIQMASSAGPVIHGEALKAIGVAAAVGRTVDRISRIGSCSGLFKGGGATAAGIMNGTSYYILGGEFGARTVSAAAVHISGAGFFLSEMWFEVVGGSRGFEGKTGQEVILTHEAMHQSNRLELNAVTFDPDGPASGEGHEERQRQNNSTVLDNCFPGEGGGLVP